MGFEVFPQGHAASDHGLGLRPVLFDEEGEVEMADEAGNEGGGEEAVDHPTEIDEVPAKAKEGKRKEVRVSGYFAYFGKQAAVISWFEST
jgi:hypothetical protein